MTGKTILSRYPGALLAALFFPALVACGTNTDQPVYPLLAVVTPPGTPSITSVTPIQVTSDSLDSYEIQFDISYYVTNTEQDFQGYNLYVSASSQPSDLPIGGSPYLPEGVSPSFAHDPSEANTSSEGLITRRVEYAKAPPSPVSFQLCQMYYFRLSAVSREGTESALGPQMSGCATVTPWLCPADSVCYQAKP